MLRKSPSLSLCAFAALILSFSFAAKAQQPAQLHRLNPFLSPSAAASADVGAGSLTANAAANSNSGGPQLQTFNYTITSTRDGNTYSGTIVGRSPFDNPFGFTAVSTQIVPIILVTNSVFARCFLHRSGYNRARRNYIRSDDRRSKLFNCSKRRADDAAETVASLSAGQLQFWGNKRRLHTNNRRLRARELL